MNDYEMMKMIIFNLAEYLNCPNEELENMIGMNWWAFHKLRHRLESEEE